MTAMVQAQSLRGYRELVTDLGGNPTRLLRKAGIEPAALNQLTAFITFESQIDLLERSAADLGCPDFGLRLAERQDIGILGTLAVAMRYSATVGEAMACASKYLHVYNAAIAFTINTGERRGQARFVFRVLPGHLPAVGANRRARHRPDLAHPDPAVGGAMPPATSVVPSSRRGHRGHLPIPLPRSPDLPLRPAWPGRSGQRPRPAHQRKQPGATRSGHPLPGPPATPRANPVHCSSPPRHRGPVGHRHLRPPPGGQRPLYASAYPATPTARRGHHLRRHQGRDPARPSRTLPVPTRPAPDPGHRPARLQRTVSVGPKLPALVPHHTETSVTVCRPSRPSRRSRLWRDMATNLST